MRTEEPKETRDSSGGAGTKESQNAGAATARRKEVVEIQKFRVSFLSETMKCMHEFSSTYKQDFRTTVGMFADLGAVYYRQLQVGVETRGEMRKQKSSRLLSLAVLCKTAAFEFVRILLPRGRKKEVTHGRS